MTANMPVLFGEVLYDCFEDGSRILGGAPFNVAWHLQAFGQQPLLISRVGDDPMGHQIRRTMIDWGMNTAGLQLDSSHATGEVQIRMSGTLHHFDILSERAWDHIDADAIPPLQPALIYHGSLGLRHRRASESFQRLTGQYPSPRYLDVNLRDPWWQTDSVRQAIAGSRWLKINDEEINTLVPEGTDLQTKAEHLLASHPLELVIVTQGARGAFSLDRDGKRDQIRPISQARVVDTVGAGDAFASVIMLSLLHQWPLSLGLQRAQQFASMVVGQRGATSRNPDQYECLRREWGL
jgi:fructokinase